MVLLHGAEVGLEPLHQPVALAARGDKTCGGAAVGVEEKIGVDEVGMASIVGLEVLVDEDGPDHEKSLVAAAGGAAVEKALETGWDAALPAEERVHIDQVAVQRRAAQNMTVRLDRKERRAAGRAWQGRGFADGPQRDHGR